MSVNAPGSYRYVHWDATYSTDQVANLLPLVWDGEPWEIEHIESVNDCNRGEGKCTHTCEEDQWCEGCLWDEDFYDCHHIHNGHDWCGKCACVDPSSRQATETRESDHHVTVIDLRQGWLHTKLDPRIREALELRHRYGWSQPSIAYRQSVHHSTIQDRLRIGASQIANYLNGGN